MLGLEEIYADSGPVLRVSAERAEGIEGIASLLAGGKLGAFVGPSGVGKSSLLNALVPDLDLRVGELNRGSGKGTAPHSHKNQLHAHQD